MKILFIGVFDNQRKSTNNSQLLAFKQLGFKVSGYNYRHKASLIGLENRDKHLAQTVGDGNFDLVVYSKCNNVSSETFKAINEKTKTCLWFMDPLISYNDEMREKTLLVDYFCCDKENVLEEALQINPQSFHVCEGFDPEVDKPRDVEKKYDVSFIGNLYGERKELINQIEHPVELINNAYGKQHSIEVSKSKINLNFCTSDGASDRVYKILSAGGFLLSNDWKNRENYLTDGKECVIFNTIDDLNEKIEMYLANPDLAKQIAEQGRKAIQQFNRLNWAQKIVELSNEV